MNYWFTCIYVYIYIYICMIAQYIFHITYQETILVELNFQNHDVYVYRALKLEYLDLYLIHWPISFKPGKPEFPPEKENLMPMDFKSVWADMEECQRLGLTKSIGVSNFSVKKLENILSFATIPPFANQVSPFVRKHDCEA